MASSTTGRRTLAESKGEQLEVSVRHEIGEIAEIRVEGSFLDIMNLHEIRVEEEDAVEPVVAS